MTLNRFLELLWAKISKIHLSKTFWINAITLAILVLEYAGDLQLPLTEVQITALLAIFNILTRMITGVPLEDKVSLMN